MAISVLIELLILDVSKLSTKALSSHLNMIFATLSAGKWLVAAPVSASTAVVALVRVSVAPVKPAGNPVTVKSTP